MAGFFETHKWPKIGVLTAVIGGAGWAMSQWGANQVSEPFSPQGSVNTNGRFQGQGQSGDTVAERVLNMSTQFKDAREELKASQKDNADWLQRWENAKREREAERKRFEEMMQASGQGYDRVMLQLNQLRGELDTRDAEQQYQIENEPLVQRGWQFEQRPQILDANGKPVDFGPAPGGLLGGDPTGNPFAPGLLGDTPSSAGTQQKPEPVITPVATIPDGATLTNAMAMSALIGRIPVRGSVPDPYKFKAIIGASNLAANGVVIPGLEGMIVQGKLVGDMLLSCTRGEIQQALFVFQDGRVVTKRKDTDGGLGHLSDARGNPCIHGEFYTNAPRVISIFGVLGGIENAGQIYEQNQKTIVTSSSTGATVEAFTGDEGKAVVGGMFSGAAGDAKSWFASHIDGSFDAVYTPAGVELILNIEEQIEIDYNDQGRRVFYERDPQGPWVSELD